MHRVGAQHQAWEVEIPLVQPGDVRTVDIAKLAIEALVDDLILLGRCQATCILIVVLVDHLEQRRKCGAELEAETTAVAQVVDPRQLFACVCLIEVLRILRIVNGSHVY